MKQKDMIKKFQGGGDDLERVERFMVKEKVQAMISHVKELELLDKANKLSKERSRELSR